MIKSIYCCIINRNKYSDWKLKFMENSEFKIQDNKNSGNFIERIKSREDMTDEEFNDFMKLSIEQAENGKSVSIDRTFNELLSKFK